MKTSHWEVDDKAFRVRDALWQVINAEEGIESLKMASFLQSLTNAERQAIYTDLFLGGVSFAWLMCVRPEAEDKIILEIQSLLAEPKKHDTPFYQRRTALGELWEESIGKRFQHGKNVRFVRHNPDQIRSVKEYDGYKITEVRADEEYYKRRLAKS